MTPIDHTDNLLGLIIHYTTGDLENPHVLINYDYSLTPDEVRELARTLVRIADAVDPSKTAWDGDDK